MLFEVSRCICQHYFHVSILSSQEVNRVLSPEGSVEILEDGMLS